MPRNDARIPLAGISTTHPTPLQMPLDIQQQRAQVQNLQADAAMRQQQQEGMQLENEQKRLEIEERRRLDEAWREAIQPSPSPAAGGTSAAKQPASTDYMKRWIESARKRGVHPNTVMKMEDGYLKLQQGYASLTKDAQDAEDRKIAAIGAQSAALLNIPDPVARQQYFLTTSRPTLLRSGFTEQDIPENIPLTDEDLQNHVMAYQISKGVHTSVKDQQTAAAQVLGLAKTQQEWDQGMANLTRSGVSQAVRASFGSWSPEAPQRARSFGMTQMEQAKAPGEQADTEQKVRASWSNKLRQARSAEEFNTILREAPVWIGDEARRVAGNNFDPNKTPQALQNWGLTSAQAGEQTDRKEAQDALAQYRKDSLDLRRQASARQNTADQRQAYTELQNFESEERALNKKLGRIVSAIKSGNLYLSDKGELLSVSRDVKNNETEEQFAARKQGYLNDMKAQYQENADNLKALIRQKYEQYGRLGVTPNTPLADINTAIDNGTQSVLNPGAKPKQTQTQQTTQPTQPYSTNADNNPLNITLGGATQKYVDSGQATVKEANGHKFLAFKDPVAGINAGRDLLFGPVYKDKKAGQALMDWSNGDYGPEVVRQAGIDPKVTIGSLNQKQRDALVAAMAPREGWKGAIPQQEQKPSPVGGKAIPEKQPQQTSQSTVRMRAPSGEIADIPADQVAHYERLGAKRI